MTTVDHDLIDQIVANVLAELQPPPTPTVRAAVTVPPVKPPVPALPAIAELNLPVITADLLAAQLRPGQAVRIGRQSIVTPSARDWLASRKISWTRTPHAGSAASSAAARWQLVLTNVTPAVATLRQSLTDWKTELLGTAQEVANHAIRVVCASEADGVLGLCSSPELAACLANRNPKLRAGVLNSSGDLPALIDQLSPNLLVLNPRGKSFIELRNLVRAVGLLSRPQPPSGM